MFDPSGLLVAIINKGILPIGRRGINMIKGYVLGLFLYFPEDKSEYIPAAITCIIFLIGAVFTMKLIIKVSKREEKKAKELEDKLKQEGITKDS
ncbi:hypothetical protein B1NLA3E_18555 [Bacillus sp. 1NLA3E]|nr:hypothetical protein B1NLA3E_18555 [Bacillus sp. 1NLA3E]